MKVLVTGGAGFIGSHLVDRLLAQGHQVVLLDNLSTGRTSTIENNLGNQGFVFYEGSILDDELVTRVATGCDAIFHLAAVVGVGYVVTNPLEGILVNTRGTENVLHTAFNLGIKILLASTSEIYGKSTKIPFREDNDRVLGSTSVARWSYSTAKALGEHLAFSYAAQGLAMTIVRYFNSYGPRCGLGGYGSVIVRFISQALAGQTLFVHGDGQQTRCFCYVDDTVEGTLTAMNQSEGEGQAFNIGSNYEITVLALARKIIELTKSSSQIEHIPYKEVFGERFEDIRRRVPDVSKAEHLLGFRAKTSLEEGLKKTIEWVAGKANGAD